MAYNVHLNTFENEEERYENSHVAKSRYLEVVVVDKKECLCWQVRKIYKIICKYIATKEHFLKKFEQSFFTIIL